jgi:MFS family permease
MSPTVSNRVGFGFLNIGHAYDHLFMLLFPTVVLGLEDEFGRTYDELLPLSIAGFVAFAAGTLPAGWLGDRWSRSGMIAVFFLGIGASSIVTGFARTPMEIAGGLTLIGIFASIYHPIGISMVVEGHEKVGKLLGFNGVFGNLGVAAAAIVAASLMSSIGWQAAFIVPGIVAIVTGILYVVYLALRPKDSIAAQAARARSAPAPEKAARARSARVPKKIEKSVSSRQVMKRVFGVVAVATIFNGLVFQGSIIALPKLFDEGLGSLADSHVGIGLMVSAVVAVAAFTQIFVGHLIDKVSIKHVWLVMLFAQVPLLAVIGWTSEAGMLIVAFAAMLMVVGEVPISDTLVARHTNDSWRSRIYGVKFLFGLGASALAPTLIILLHTPGGGFHWLFVSFAAMAFIVAVATFWLPGQKRQDAAAAPGAV